MTAGRWGDRAIPPHFTPEYQRILTREWLDRQPVTQAQLDRTKREIMAGWSDQQVRMMDSKEPITLAETAKLAATLIGGFLMSWLFFTLTR